MDDSERRPPAPNSNQSQRLSKVIRGDAANPDNPLNEKPVLSRPPARAGVMNAETFEAHTSAQQIIANAEKKAAEILAEAQKGKDEVFAKAQAAAEAAVAAKTVEEIARAKLQAGQILADSEGDIIDLACKVAAKIIGRDLERDPQVLIEICATATESARAAKAMIMRVNPKDAAVLRANSPKLMQQIGRTVEIAIREDSDIEVGGCVIQTEFGSIDAQIRTQVAMLQTVLKGDPGKKEAK